MAKMIFTEALRLQIKFPYEKKAIAPKLYGATFDLTESLQHMCYKDAYKLTLNWNFIAYLDSGFDENDVRKNAIREMNKVVYGDFTQALIEAKECIKYGNEDNAIQILDYLISEITQTFRGNNERPNSI